jgi:hypothetical protein
MVFILQIKLVILPFLFNTLIQASPAPTSLSPELVSTGISPRPTEEAVLVDPFGDLKRRDYGDICGYATGNTRKYLKDMSLSSNFC